ncbi:MAG: VF530 family DNA-binding protein [Campylobacterota bacterium]|nr:VF530 family DNA-binding protein [Campylobacterota bacterium]
MNLNLLNVVEYVIYYGQALIRCFLFDPTINSSLKFLRKTPWARIKVEELYIKMKSQS